MLMLLSIVLAASNPYFGEAKRLSNELKFAEAIEQLKVARQVPGLSEAERVEVLELLARCFVAEGRRAEAQATWEELLVVQPTFAPDRSLSPKILETFDAAKEKVFPLHYFKLEPLPSPPGRARLKVIDPWQRAASFQLSMRVDTETDWKVTALTPEAQALTIALVGAPLRTLEWFVTAYDSGGEQVGEYGNAEKPQRHTVPTVEAEAMVVVETPRIQRWPAWVSMSIAVVAASVGAVFQYNSVSRARLLDDRTMPPGDWADTARAEHALATRDATIATSLFVVSGAAVVVGTLVFVW